MIHHLVLLFLALLGLEAVTVSGSDVLPPLPPSVDQLFQDINFNGIVRIRNGPHSLIGGKDYGYTDIVSQRPINGTTARFPIGSNTKLHVALALYQLQERGLVNLSHNVADYLDAHDFQQFGLPNMSTYCPTVVETPNQCQNITFVQLLGMSAGISGGNFYNFFLPYPGSIGLAVGQYLAAPLLFVPGTSFYYSNPSFMLAAYFVEKFSKMSLKKYIRMHIWNLVRQHGGGDGKEGGMTHTDYDPYKEEFLIDEHRVGEYYHYKLTNASGKTLGWGKCSVELDPGQINGAGGFTSTVDDEAALYYSLFNFTVGAMGRPFLMHPESLLEMVRPRTATGSPRWFAQGVWVMTYSSSTSRGSKHGDNNNHHPDHHQNRHDRHGARRGGAPFAPPNWTQPYPPFIFYEGETICSHTANFFDVSQHPPLLVQAWKNVAVMYPTQQQWMDALSTEQGAFMDITATWATPEPLHAVAWAAHNHWAPAPPSN